MNRQYVIFVRLVLRRDEFAGCAHSASDVTDVLVLYHHRCARRNLHDYRVEVVLVAETC